MNRSKLMTILLFLLLLLIILCTWFHSPQIANKQTIMKSTPHITMVNEDKPKPINFYFTKNENKFALTGNFANQENVNKLHNSLDVKDLKDTTIINSKLKNNLHVISLTQSILPLFNKFINGSITYEEDKLTIKGTVDSETTKTNIENLLHASEIEYINSINVVIAGPTDEEIAAIKLKKEQEEANRIAKIEAEKLAQEEKRVAELKAKEEADRVAKLEAEKIAQEEKRVAELKAQEEAEKVAKLEAEKIAREKLIIAAHAIEEEIKHVIDLENINFEVNKARLTEKSIDTISHIANILQEHKNISVEIAGHTDSDGDEKYNLTLSQKRVDTVKKRLIEMNIDTARLTAIGYGETQPIVDNDTKENKQLNRRVEFKVKGE